MAVQAFRLGAWPNIKNIQKVFIPENTQGIPLVTSCKGASLMVAAFSVEDPNGPQNAHYYNASIIRYNLQLESLTLLISDHSHSTYSVAKDSFRVSRDSQEQHTSVYMYLWCSKIGAIGVSLPVMISTQHYCSFFSSLNVWDGSCIGRGERWG